VAEELSDEMWEAMVAVMVREADSIRAANTKLATARR
jgi:hypothetical protein